MRLASCKGLPIAAHRICSKSYKRGSLYFSSVQSYQISNETHPQTEKLPEKEDEFPYQTLYLGCFAVVSISAPVDGYENPLLWESHLVLTFFARHRGMRDRFIYVQWRLLRLGPRVWSPPLWPLKPLSSGKNAALPPTCSSLKSQVCVCVCKMFWEMVNYQ